MLDYVKFESTRIEHVPYEKTIHEHRAPTDDSVKLLMELEKAAEDRLIRITKLDANDFNATYHVFENCYKATLDVVCQFKINSKEYRVDVSVPRRTGTYELVAAVYEKIADELAKILTSELFSSQAGKEIFTKGRI